MEDKNSLLSKEKRTRLMMIRMDDQASEGVVPLRSWSEDFIERAVAVIRYCQSNEVFIPEEV